MGFEVEKKNQEKKNNKNNSCFAVYEIAKNKVFITG